MHVNCVQESEREALLNGEKIFLVRYSSFVVSLDSLLASPISGLWSRGRCRRFLAVGTKCVDRAENVLLGTRVTNEGQMEKS